MDKGLKYLKSCDEGLCLSGQKLLVYNNRFLLG